MTAAPAPYATMQATAPPQPFVPSEEALQSLLQMGFDRDSALRALEQANNDVSVAISLLV